jgi:hypothetical protein
MTRRLFAVFAVTFGCGSEANTVQPDAEPDAEVIVDAGLDAAICVPSTVACIGDAIVACAADGTPTTSATCDLGCDASGGAPKCNVLQPTNIAATTCDAAAAADLVITSGITTIDTGSNCDSVIAQTGGPAICVRAFTNISIAQGATLRAVGTRALALVATNGFTVDGTIDVSANGPNGGPAVAGPGAPVVTGAGGNGGDGTTDDASVGGGGAGAGTTGAAGSTPIAQGAGGTAGASIGNPTLSPLVAGATGGRNGAPTASNRVAAGGLGGGALQLVACHTFTLGASALVDASGSGGEGGPGATSLLAPGGGGGGGSGGGVLIEAASVSIGGSVGANGGAGGGGGLHGSTPATTGLSGAPGADGSPGTTVAVGGDGPAESGAGGAGGVLAIAPAVGEAPAVSTGAGGGGGGAVGRIRINVRSGATPAITGSVSPAASIGSVMVHPQP